MPSPYLLAFELLVYGLLFLCARHAWRSGGVPVLWQLVAGIAFGVLLEWATSEQLQAYEYGRSLIMFGEVPLAIGIGWGVIIYSARLYSEATSLSPLLRPVFAGLLALNIDLAMDAVAIRLSMWQWGFDITSQYYGVPYANFWAWFWVVFSFSAGVRFFVHRKEWSGQWLAPVAGILLGVVVVVSTNRLIVYHIPLEVHKEVVVAFMGIILVVVMATRPNLDAPSLPGVAAWVPLGFHLYFLVAGVLWDVFARIPFLFFVSVLMTLIALALHWPAVRRAFHERGGARTGTGSRMDSQ